MTDAVDELNADILGTRAELAETLRELAVRADLRTRTTVRMTWVAEATARLRTTVARRASTPAGVVLGVTVMALAGTALLRTIRGNQPPGGPP